MTAAGAVVEEERLIAFRHLVQELNAVLHPALIQIFHIFRRNISDSFLLAAAYRVHIILAERQIFDVFGTGWAERHFRIDVNIAPFGIHIGNGVKAAEIIEADILRL